MFTFRQGTLPALLRPQRPARYIAITALRPAGCSTAITSRRRPLSSSSAQSWHTSESPPLAPLILHPSSREIPNSYHVRFKKDTPGSIIEAHFAFLESAQDAHPLLPVDGGPSGITRIYFTPKKSRSGLDGYKGRFSAGVIEELRSRREVKCIEKEYYFAFKAPPGNVGSPRNIVL